LVAMPSPNAPMAKTPAAVAGRTRRLRHPALCDAAVVNVDVR
jgi:hypothetical protein